MGTIWGGGERLDNNRMKIEMFTVGCRIFFMTHPQDLGGCQATGRSGHSFRNFLQQFAVLVSGNVHAK